MANNRLFKKKNYAVVVKSATDDPHRYRNSFNFKIKWRNSRSDPGKSNLTTSAASFLFRVAHVDLFYRQNWKVSVLIVAVVEALMFLSCRNPWRSNRWWGHSVGGFTVKRTPGTVTTTKTETARFMPGVKKNLMEGFLQVRWSSDLSFRTHSEWLNSSKDNRLRLKIV